ncbi:sensor domain-containing diguanylate cyclase [Hydrogenovibrio kuenenii]|uniref:sensor domain-containing diguanylate cyclase n=1 Tax=Hydrogenovibrio kuenenii TaxID=63658 RepID=UPI000466EF33|nr:sensor domain-containing diguanylate cyclase [Hydrogenovibrio kuenenii]
MKFDSNIKIVAVISLLLVFLSISISLINFSVSLSAKQKELKTRSLPLSVDNISTEIQRNIIQPNLISSIMAHDTFVKHWLVYDEQDTTKIQSYLKTIQEKYGMFVTFLVSEKTLRYYSQKGFIEKMSSDKPDNKWYFRFKNEKNNHEINLDYNDKFSNSMIMFINHKIFDNSGKLIGATGIGMRMSYIDSILKHFREQYQFTVFFINKDGKVILRERKTNKLSSINDIPALAKLKNDIYANEKKVLEYTQQGQHYLLNTQYIPELGAYLLVQADLNDFTKQVRKTFYLNLSISLIITLVVTLFILTVVRSYNRKLEFFAHNDPITHLKNRRSFNEYFEKLLPISQKSGHPLSLIFFDVDDFKEINDQLGHQIGDQVLARMGEILHNLFKDGNLIARWGGEEFIIALANTSLTTAEFTAEHLKNQIEQDDALIKLRNKPITISVGVTSCRVGDSPDSIFHRLDDAMYTAKKTGKNKVITD